MPIAAVASDLIATWPHKQKSFRIACSAQSYHNSCDGDRDDVVVVVIVMVVMIIMERNASCETVNM